LAESIFGGVLTISPTPLLFRPLDDSVLLPLDMGKKFGCQELIVNFDCSQFGAEVKIWRDPLWELSPYPFVDMHFILFFELVKCAALRG
jgi:hypothetical protein